MKLLCDKDEFALLVRECMLTESQRGCRGCLFKGLCGEDVGMDSIEDICEIVTEG